MTTIRLKRQDLNAIDELRRRDEVREQAVEQGVVDEIPEDGLSYEQTLLTIIPEDAEPIERPEEDMMWRSVGDAKDRIIELSGENVSVHEVVTLFTAEYVDKHGFDIETGEMTYND